MYYKKKGKISLEPNEPNTYGSIIIEFIIIKSSPEALYICLIRDVEQ